ncbi:ASCH domain-containing protein [Sporosarcina sp. UB5]|uniref:ASCH domain-containing protein n=1 Tax=Sporosarcina sp. UB5 TaxID=3047463 RepID=UPI003D7A68C4
MNQAAKSYWESYWGDKERPASVTAWMFGDTPDELAQLVIEEKKTATCSAHVLYELENEPLPTTEDYSIILNSKEEPVAIIKTTDVSIVPMNEVTEEFALAEGEGSYEEWKEIHDRYFKSELLPRGIKFSEDMLLVCERFTLIDVNNREKF